MNNKFLVILPLFFIVATLLFIMLPQLPPSLTGTKFSFDMMMWIVMLPVLGIGMFIVFRMID